MIKEFGPGILCPDFEISLIFTVSEFWRARGGGFDPVKYCLIIFASFDEEFQRKDNIKGLK